MFRAMFRAMFWKDEKGNTVAARPEGAGLWRAEGAGLWRAEGEGLSGEGAHGN
jgi:hypothetical protein